MMLWTSSRQLLEDEMSFLRSLKVRRDISGHTPRWQCGETKTNGNSVCVACLDLWINQLLFLMKAGLDRTTKRGVTLMYQDVKQSRIWLIPLFLFFKTKQKRSAEFTVIYLLYFLSTHMQIAKVLLDWEWSRSCSPLYTGTSHTGWSR